MNEFNKLCVLSLSEEMTLTHFCRTAQKAPTNNKFTLPELIYIGCLVALVTVQLALEM